MYTIEKTEEFETWILNLKNPVVLKQIAARLLRLEAGHLGDYKAFDGIIELRFHSRGGTRIYCLKDGDTLIVLLVGGDKDSQSSDIEQAKRLAKDYLERKDENN